MRSHEFHGKGSIRYNGTERICSRLGDRTFSLDCSASLTPQTQQRLGTRIMNVDQRARAELLEVVEAGDVPVEFPNVLNLITLLSSGSNANSNPNPNSNSNSNPHSNANTSNDIFYYHTNHLGSTSFVTDQNQTITQGFLYAPFGEITTEYNVNFGNNVIPKYSFNAKELDEETGMYYYEARYMAPPMFISRDPHFERYFWTSPYGYCSNNPLNRVDPTGMDEWEIDGSGNVVNHTKTTEHDAFYMVDKDGNRINGKSCEFEYGVVESFHSQYSDKNQSQFDWYNVRGDEQGKQLFEFFANNTNVEWGQLQLGQKGNHGLNVITTSHNKSRESCGSWLIGNKYQYGYTIRKHIHNHPDNTAYPSGLQKGNKDIGFAKRISKISSNISLQIYLPQSGKYINYNALSQPEDFPAFPCPTYTLKGVTVKAHK